MRVSFGQLTYQLDAEKRTICVRGQLVNHSNEIWKAEEVCVAWQVFDPETAMFILEGKWIPLAKDLAPAETSAFETEVQLPPEKGRYHVYLSLVHSSLGWFYASGEPFVLVDAYVEHHVARIQESQITTVRSLQIAGRWRSVQKAFTVPVQSVWKNASLIRSMVRRDINARYKGSFGDVLWTVLNPLLLMGTYFFVFGVVLHSDPNQSRTEFVLSFLAGMLPWLAFSEAVGRSPYVVVEHRNFVKKLVFPLEILPIMQGISGLVTQAFATLVFLVALILIRGSIPVTVLWLPVLLIPQLLFTLGISWFLSALGVYMRDLGQIIGFVLTLWFFLTPICYPEASLPPQAAMILAKNPIFVLVKGYRNIFLHGQSPEAVWKLWLLAITVFFLGHAWFYKLRKTFADVI